MNDTECAHIQDWLLPQCFVNPIQPAVCGFVCVLRGGGGGGGGVGGALVTFPQIYLANIWYCIALPKEFHLSMATLF